MIIGQDLHFELFATEILSRWPFGITTLGMTIFFQQKTLVGDIQFGHIVWHILTFHYQEFSETFSSSWIKISN